MITSKKPEKTKFRVSQFAMMPMELPFHGNALDVYYQILQRQNLGSFYPTRSYLKTKTGLKDKAINTALQTLREYGYLKVIHIQKAWKCKEVYYEVLPCPVCPAYHTFYLNKDLELTSVSNFNVTITKKVTCLADMFSVIGISLEEELTNSSAPAKQHEATDCEPAEDDLPVTKDAKEEPTKGCVQFVNVDDLIPDVPTPEPSAIQPFFEDADKGICLEVPHKKQNTGISQSVIKTANNSNLSILFSSKPITKAQREATVETVKSQISYDELCKRLPASLLPVLDNLVKVMVDTKLSYATSFYVNRMKVSRDYVLEKLDKLDYEHIEYVLECYEASKGRSLRPAYLLTCLVNAPDTIDHYYRLDVMRRFGLPRMA